MIRTDKEFKILVHNICRSTFAPERAMILEASGYLWDSMNMERLWETSHGRFLRECSVNNPSPDLSLRALYRKQVLSEVNFEE